MDGLEGKLEISGKPTTETFLYKLEKSSEKLKTVIIVFRIIKQELYITG